MEKENQDSTPPLDSSLAPALLFERRPGHCSGAEAGDETTEDDDGSRFLYSIPKRRLLVVRGFDYLTNNSDSTSWITPQGWVLVLDPITRDACLRDPFSSRTVHLPSDHHGISLLPTSNEHTRCFLSTTHPHRPANNNNDADPGCVVLLVHLEDPVLWYCYCTGSRWFRHEYSPELIAGDDHGSAMSAMGRLTAARGGKFYAHAFDVEEDKFVTLEFPPPAAGPPVFSVTRVGITPWLPGMYQVRLIESCGDLFVLRISLEPFRTQASVLEIYVYKLMVMSSPDDNVNNACWVRVAALGDNRVFFSGRDKDEFGASMAADELGLKANCIYFTLDDDKGLYVHDLERGTTILHNPGQDVPDSIEPLLLMHAQS